MTQRGLTFDQSSLEYLKYTKQLHFTNRFYQERKKWLYPTFSLFPKSNRKSIRVNFISKYILQKSIDSHKDSKIIENKLHWKDKWSDGYLFYNRLMQLNYEKKVKLKSLLLWFSKLFEDRDLVVKNQRNENNGHHLILLWWEKSEGKKHSYNLLTVMIPNFEQSGLKIVK